MLFHIVLYHLKIFVHGLDLRISRFLQNRLLDKEAKSALKRRGHLRHIILESAVNFHIVYMSVRLRQVFEDILIHAVQIGVFGDLILQRNKRARIHQLGRRVPGKNNIRIIAACDHNTQLLIQIAHQKFKF